MAWYGGWCGMADGMAWQVGIGVAWYGGFGIGMANDMVQQLGFRHGGFGLTWHGSWQFVACGWRLAQARHGGGRSEFTVVQREGRRRKG